MPKDVFISYAQPDKSWAELVCSQLEDAGIGCWIAPRDIAPGVTWPAAITEAIANCRTMIIIFSTHANQSPHMAREVECADNRRVPILPVRVENVAPSGDLEYFLGNRQWFDLHDRTLERRIGGLPEAISGLLGDPGKAIPTPMPPPPRRASSGKRNVWIGVGAVGLVAAGTAFYALQPKPAAPVNAAPVQQQSAPAPPPDSPPSVDSRAAAPAKETPRAAPKAAPVAAKVVETRAATATPQDTGNFAGTWQATVKYSWGITLNEKFNLKVDGNEVYGTAGYVGAARGIRDGKIDGHKISFNTRSTTMLGDKTYEEKHYYEGRMGPEGIEFVLQTDSGYDSRPPEEFTAKKVE